MLCLSTAVYALYLCILYAINCSEKLHRVGIYASEVLVPQIRSITQSSTLSGWPVMNRVNLLQICLTCPECHSCSSEIPLPYMFLKLGIALAVAITLWLVLVFNHLLWMIG